jgi:hypothetical protein
MPGIEIPGGKASLWSAKRPLDAGIESAFTVQRTVGWNEVEAFVPGISMPGTRHALAPAIKLRGSAESYHRYEKGVFMVDIEAKAREVYEQGFCVLPALWSEDELIEIRHSLDAYWESQGSPELAGFGMGIHPLLEKVPAVTPYFVKQEIVDIIGLVLQDDVRLTHTGARLSDESSATNIGWHNHYSWDAATIPHRDKIERVLGGVYVDGSTAATGPLIALPRRYNDPLSEPGDSCGDWPGQVVVEAPPGSGVIFDTALWHTAARGNAPGRRRLFGAHYQGWSDPRPHPEDNIVGSPELERYKREIPLLSRLLDGP